MALMFEDLRTIPEYLASKVIQCGEIPKHVAVILDGNRRYARNKNAPVIEGHKSGSYTFQKFCGWMRELGVKELTGYVFAIENFNRPEDEVTGILEEIRKIIEGVLEFLEHERETTMLQLLGDWSFVPDNLKPRIARITALTKNVNAKLRVNLAFCYSARHELENHTEKVQKGVQNGQLLEDDVTFDLIRQLPHLRHTYPVDLLIRTSGETRLSNFLLLETKDAMLEFIPENWPEMSFMRSAEILLRYQQFRRGVPRKEEAPFNERQRRFLEDVREEMASNIISDDDLTKGHGHKAPPRDGKFLRWAKFWFEPDQE